MGKLRSLFQAVSAFGFVLAAHSAVAVELAGTITDLLTNQPMSGVHISVRTESNTFEAYSGSDGRFSVTIELPETTLTSVTAIISSPDYDNVSRSVQVQNGQAIQPLNVPMPLHWISTCKPGYEHSIVVGFFLPPSVSGTQSELSDRIALSLGSALIKRLQQVHLDANLLPTFWPCPSAKPRIPELGAAIAKVLLADGFVGGEVAHSAAEPAFKVSTYVNDAYDRLRPFVRAESLNVDLDSPSGATMADDTHAAVLASVAAGIISKGDCATAMKVLAAAEQIAGSTPTYISKMKEFCVAQLPNRLLLRGNTP